MKLLGYLITACLLGFATNSLAQDQSVSVDKKVSMFFAKMDDMGMKKDVIGLRDGYAPDAIITLRMKTAQGIQEQKLSRDTMLLLITENFAMAKSYSISRKISSISPDSTNHRITIGCIEVERIAMAKEIAVATSKNKYVLTPAKGSYLIIEHESELLDMKTKPSSY